MAFQKVLKGFTKTTTEIPLTVLCGGLFLDKKFFFSFLPNANFLIYREGNKRINQRTCAEFGPVISKLVERKVLLNEFERCCQLGFSALRSFAPGRFC